MFSRIFQAEEAPAPLEIILKSSASGSVPAYIATARYADALPLYRQEAIFKRVGLDLSRQTMTRWMFQVGDKLAPLITLLREELLKSSYIHMDETIVQVLKEEDGKKAESNSYMWVQARLGPRPIVLFHYAKNRSGTHAHELLDDYRGSLQLTATKVTLQLLSKMRSLALVAGHMLEESSLMRSRARLGRASVNKGWGLLPSSMRLKKRLK